MDTMIPTINFRYFMEHDAESTEDEELLPVPSTLSDDSNPSVHSISAVEVIDLTSPIPSMSTMPPIFSIEMPPVPSTSRDVQEYYDDFRFEAARRSSFRNWPVSFIDPVSLAAAEFYYTRNFDVVRCFECQLVASQWSVVDIPMQIHEMRSPECRFIRNEHCNNVPIGADPAKVRRTKRKNRNISCPYGLQYQKAFDFNDHRFLRHSRNPTAYELSRLGLKRTGINDCTTCYHCGIGIGSWRAEDDPWEQHAISSPSCCYLLTVRGWEYVNKVTGQELYETAEGAIYLFQAAIQIANGNPERSTSENDTNEMTLVGKIGK
ncbi:E3 ubiquitin-protein ligase XIAP-like [Bombus flavifrons]|uniref:E3 ubiquitin-protein ligase XIAP-like n=1 Tax=Bombus flavifrons TaxID=103934 RepID=UPI003703EFB9